MVAIVSVGCGEREAYEVRGKVQYQDGSPITGGVRVIRLEPTQDTTAKVLKAASANIAEDGTFEMFTRRPGDGVFAGKYAVTFTVLQGAMDARPLIAEKYSLGDQTPFELVVDGDKTDLLYELEKQ